MKAFLSSFLAIGGLAAAADTHTFTGTITDSMCSNADHAPMRMGPTDAECIVACILEHDAMYVLYDGKDVYMLSDQQTPKKFAAQKVIVKGTVDVKTKTIHVDSITKSK